MTDLFDPNYSAECREAGWKASYGSSKGQRAEIWASLKAFGSQTAQELAKGSGMKLASVNGRLNELLAQGLVRKSGTKVNPDSGVKNCLWEAV